MAVKFKEHDRVRLTKAQRDMGLDFPVGLEGVIIDAYPQSDFYEVEFAAYGVSILTVGGESLEGAP